MAQVVKLKRTSVQGRIPNISNLELGELAINTHDGRIFFQKDDGTLSIQEILTTNSDNSGSFSLQGAISASSLSISGDTTIGGNLTLGGNITIGDETTDSINITAEFSNSLLPDGNEVYDLGSSIKKWNNIWVKDVRGTDVYGSTSVQAPTGSFDVIDLDRLSLTSTQTTVSPLHLTATNLNDGVGALRIDGAQADIYLNPTTSTHTTVTFAVGGSPKLAFGMDSSDDFYITRNNGTSWYDDTFVLDRNTGEVTLGYDLTVNGNINATNGIISGSSQLTSSFDSRYLNVSGDGTISGSFTGSFNGDGSGLTNLQVSSSIVEATTVTSSFDSQTSVVVNHNFDSRNIIVSVYDTEYEQIIPQSVILTDNDNVTITFPTAESGIVVVAKGGHIVSSDSLTTYRVDVSGASSYAVSHSLDEEYPFVQTWNTDTNKQEQPLDVESTSPSSLTVTFSGNFTGKIIVKK